MARETFARKADLGVAPAEAWQRITDVPTLVEWVSIVHDATVITELDRYTAVLEDRIGIFSLKADLDIVVVEHRAPDLIRVRAEGEDRQVGSRIVVDARVQILAVGARTELHVDGSYEVTGRVAGLGSGLIRKKATRILDEFFDRIARELS